MAHTKTSFALPYKKEIIFCGLRVGLAVKVKLCINQDACAFQIKFLADDCGRTIPLQFNCYLSDQTVTLNTKDGCWQVPEIGPGCFPFQRGQCYDIDFFSSCGCFQIYVNGCLYTTYNHRIDVERIRHLKINGNITLTDVKIN